MNIIFTLFKNKTTACGIFILVIQFIATGAAAQPVITSISPDKAGVGTNIVINGTGFNPVATNNTVYFGSVKGAVTSATGTAVSVTVPTGFSADPVSITTNNLTAYTLPFNVTFAGGGPFTSGSFAPKVDITSPYPNDVASCDVDGDGKTELVTANYFANTVSVFKNTSLTGTINFLTKTDWPVGVNPGKITVADIDGDGLKDIIVGNQGFSAYSISILRNTSTGSNISFAPKIDYPLTATPYNFTVGEIDGDGKPEIIINGSNTSNIIIFRNASVPGTVSFASSLTVSTGLLSDGVVVADINANGKADIITCNGNNNKITILNNTSSVGSISFGTPVTFATGQSPVAIAVGNLDNDVKPDIVVTNTGGYSISVIQNTSSVGTVSFNPTPDLPANAQLWDVKIADIDGDGMQDIICGTASDIEHKISVYRNTGTGTTITFDNRVDYTTSTNTKQLAIADLDNDGTLDIVATQNNANKLTVFRNKVNTSPIISSFTPTVAGTGALVTISGTNLANATAVSFGGVPVISFTINSDISITAIVGAGASGNVNVTSPGGVGSLAGFTFTAAPSITAISPLSGPVGQLVNITGNNFGSSPANNIVYFGGAQATVTAASPTALSVIVPTNANYQPVSVTSNYYTAWYNQQPFDITFPNGDFSPTTFLEKINIFDNNLDEAESLVLADIDNDGKSDIIVHSFITNTMYVYRNITQTGIIAFAAAVGFPSNGSHTKNISVADFNGDGKLDVAVPNEWSGPISVFKNTSTPGTISFAVPVQFPVGVDPNHISAGDIDGDGMADLVVSNVSSTGISVLRNISTPATIKFDIQKIYTTRSYNSYCNFIGDVDGDGKLDIITTNLDSTFSAFKNISTIGNINMAARQDYFCGHRTSFVTMTDIDGDGKKDIALGTGMYGGVGMYDTTIVIVRNISTPGNFNFAPRIDVRSSMVWNIAFHDMDGDNKPDMLYNSYDTCNVVKNISTPGNIVFGNKINFLTSSNHLNGIAAADLDNDGKPDIAAIANTGANRLFVLVNQTGVNPPLCTGDSGTLNANITGTLYFWQLNTGSGFNNIFDGTDYSGTSTATLHLINVQPSWNGYKYRCFVIGASSSYSTTYTLTVNGNTPIVSIAATTTCTGSAVSFTATPVYGGTAPAFQWQVNGINAGTNSNVFTTATLNSGDQVKVILTSNCNCSNGVNVESNIITMIAGTGVPPSVNITAGSTAICAGSSVSFNAIPTNGGSAPSYQWQVNGINVGANSSSFTTSTLTNNAQVKVILTSSLSCAVPSTATSNIITISVTAASIANTGNDTAICAGSSIQLNGSGGTTYLWTPSAGLSNPNVANPIASPATTTIYILTVSNGASCFSRDTMQISVNLPVAPAVTISSPNNNICAGTPVTFTAAVSNGGTNPTYQWQVNTINTGTNSNTFTSSALNNNDQVKAILTSSASCLTTPTATSNIIAMNVQQLVTPLVSLNNRLYTVTNPDIAATYTWQSFTAGVWNDVVPAATGTSYTATAAGEYRVKAVKGPCTSFSISQSTNKRTVSNNPFGIYLYPNPSSRTITLDSIKLSQHWETLVITDVAGKRVSPAYNIQNKNTFTLDVYALKNGIYFIQLRKNDGEITTIKFIKQ